jgi:hypothetical protein
LGSDVSGSDAFDDWEPLAASVKEKKSAKGEINTVRRTQKLERKKEEGR